MFKMFSNINDKINSRTKLNLTDSEFFHISNAKNSLVNSKLSKVFSNHPISIEINSMIKYLSNLLDSSLSVDDLELPVSDNYMILLNNQLKEIQTEIELCKKERGE